MLDLGFRGRSRLRLVRQTELAECGLASLTMIANYYGLEVDLPTMRRRFAPSPRGARLKSLIGVADEIGLSSRAVKLPLQDISKLRLPCILHWDLNHYVVLGEVKGNKLHIYNPVGISTWMSIQDVSDHFTGVALELQPASKFEKINVQEKLSFRELWRNVKGLKRALLQVLVLTIILQAFVLFTPYYMQIVLDKALPEHDYNLLTVLAVGFGILCLFNAFSSILRSYILLHTGSMLSFSLTSSVARRLFRLPVEWFERRHVGDVLSRFQSVVPIQSLLTAAPVAALVDGFLAILTMAVIIWYSPLLASVVFGACILNTLLRIVSFNYERDALELSIISLGKQQSIFIESLRGMTTLRLFAREMLRHASWQNRLVDSINADARVAKIGIWQNALGVLIFGLENVITVWFAVGLVISGSGFSVGMIFAFLAYKVQFLEKSSSLVSQVISYKMLGLHLSRLSDIVLSDEDKSFRDVVPSGLILSGRIELRNVYYRYAPSEPLIINGLNLTIEPGEHVAITGPSGGGKTTLVKLILGLVEPTAGEVLIDGLPMHRFGYKNYHRQVAAVLQEDSLFAGSLADNIALFDENIDMESVVSSAKAASIHDDIERMPMQYETLIGDMGSTLSGGQKQRVLLARAIYRRPRVLIMDEGTAHLDIVRERAVNSAIDALGITRIVIAHRQETVCSAKRLLILAGGELQQELQPRRADDLNMSQ